LEEAVEGEKIFSSPTQPKVESEATPTPGSVILSKAAPMDAAIQFAKDLLRVEGTLATYYFHGDCWQWNGRFYEMAPAERIGGMVCIYLQGAKIGTSDDNQRYRPRPENAEALLKCLKVCVAIDDRDVPPLWLDGRSGSADGLLVFRNCLVDAATGEVFALTPQLWAQGGVDFDFAPDAAAPRWEQFLEEVFPGDRESQDTVEEQLGYGMTNDTRFEKGALWVGVKRSGKSTLLWLQEQLVGAGAYTSLSFHDWMKTENSRSHMIGKKIGVFPDVRLKPAKVFGTVGYDPGGIDHQSAQLLLQIIGRDTVSLGRKFKEAWLGRLMIKFIITTNEVPNLSDAGGALSARFIMLEFKQSFFGREDITLRDKLRAELHGIANRCLAAYRRLCARGRFIQPKAGLELAQKIEAKGNAYAAFMNDCFVEDPGGEGVLCGAFFAAFQSWCRDARRLDLLTETPQTLIKNVKGVERWQHLKSVRGGRDEDQKRPRHYPGIWPRKKEAAE
jgi:putative DNA primase/helicase